MRPREYQLDELAGVCERKLPTRLRVEIHDSNEKVLAIATGASPPQLNSHERHHAGRLESRAAMTKPGTRYETCHQPSVFVEQCV